ncbi:hypothetical protein T439DRAFT_316359 [Meredithblackwellia eburnea MCA 4105]
MASTQISLTGQLSSEIHSQVILRLSTHAEQGLAYETTETTYERAGMDLVTADENILRLRQTRLSNNPQNVFSSLQVLQKPESARISPEFLQRSLIEAPIAEGDPFELASALGYSRKKTTHQKGIRFMRGAVEILVYQLYSSSTSPTPITPTTYTVTLTTRSANPRVGPSSAAGGAGAGGAPGATHQQHSAQELKSEAIERLRECRAVLQGLVNLSREGDVEK